MQNKTKPSSLSKKASNTGGRCRQSDASSNCGKRSAPRRRDESSSGRAIRRDEASQAFRPGTKAAAIIDRLKTPDGATVGELMEATGWQAHSVRGFLSATLKQKHGLTIVSEKRDGIRRYRIPA